MRTCSWPFKGTLANIPVFKPLRYRFLTGPGTKIKHKRLSRRYALERRKKSLSPRQKCIRYNFGVFVALWNTAVKAKNQDLYSNLKFHPDPIWWHVWSKWLDRWLEIVLYVWFFVLNVWFRNTEKSLTSEVYYFMAPRTCSGY